MSISLTKLQARPLIFLRLLGVTPQDFKIITKKCTPLWNSRLQDKKKVSGRPYGLRDLEHHILCLLLYYRCYTSQLFLGFLFDVDDSCVCRSIKRLEPILSCIMGIKKDRTLTEKELCEIIVDCTEQPIQRPKKGQKKYYSGKKKRHTLKTEIRITGEGKIKGVSRPRAGKIHDFEIFKKEKPLPPHCRIYADSGYQGLDKRHKQTELPYKKPKGGKLSVDEKEYNRGLSSFRVRVENKIRELKTFNILSQTYRNFRKGYAIKFTIIAGIVNLKAGF